MPRLKIIIEDTPNPDAMKFTVDRPIAAALGLDRPDRPRSFADAHAAASDPLAARLFALKGVTNVMYVNDFCTVNKTGKTRWKPLIAQIKDALQQTLT